MAPTAIEEKKTSEASTEVKSYADGWITERKGTEIPAFLKFAYIVIACGCFAYFLDFHEWGSQSLHARRAGAAV